MFLIVLNQTRGDEAYQKRIVRRGKLYFLEPDHSAEDDEAVAVEEYDKAWTEFKVSNYGFSYSEQPIDYSVPRPARSRRTVLDRKR